jgi:hypothetical protein
MSNRWSEDGVMMMRRCRRSRALGVDERKIGMWAVLAWDIRVLEDVHFCL